MIAVACLFSQIPSHVPRVEFASLVKKHRAEHKAKGFTCWWQFVAMLIAHVAQANSLRGICYAPMTARHQSEWGPVSKSATVGSLPYSPLMDLPIFPIAPNSLRNQALPRKAVNANGPMNAIIQFLLLASASSFSHVM